MGGSVRCEVRGAVAWVTLSHRTARAHKQALRALGAGAMTTERVERLLPGACAYAPAAEHRDGIAAFVAKRPALFSSIEPEHD